MRYTGGWFKFERFIITTEIMRDPLLLQLYVYLKATANFKESTIKWKGQKRILLPGQNLISITDLAKILNGAPTTYQRKLKWLEDGGFLTREMTHHGQIITIYNYNQIEESENQDGAPNGAQVGHQWGTDGAPSGAPTGVQEEVEKELRKKKEERNSFSGDANASPAPVVQVMIPEKKPRQPRTPKPPVEKSDGSRVWEAYAEAYAQRWGSPPVRNAQSNALCSQLVARLGATEAPEVARFFVSHNEKFYVLKLHPLKLLVGDCEKLRTEWFNGSQMNNVTALRFERKSANDEAFKQYYEMKRREEEGLNQ